MRSALALWRGPPLADVVFEGPARHEVGRLSELHLSTQIELLEAELELGRHAALVGELELLVAAHPYQERLRALLMLALYRSGRQAEALEAYRATRRQLNDELGLEPGQVLRELEAAILRQDVVASVGAPPKRAQGPSVATKAATSTDDLRPLTALFADVVGSKALSARLSSEDADALVGECLALVSQAVEEFGGTVQATMDDAIAAVFGIPHAHEDDPERAARTALRILEVVGAYAHDIADAWGIPDFAVRIGIAAGRVGVGSIAAGSAATAVPDDVINLAAHVQAAAAPGTVAVSEETVRRLASRFELEPLGRVSMKGRASPVRASRLVGPTHPARASRLRALVGREWELDRIRAVVSISRPAEVRSFCSSASRGSARPACSRSCVRSSRSR